MLMSEDGPLRLFPIEAITLFQSFLIFIITTPLLCSVRLAQVVRAKVDAVVTIARRVVTWPITGLLAVFVQCT